MPFLTSCMGAGLGLSLAFLTPCAAYDFSFPPARIVDQRFEKVAYFVFGDFNFRLDSKSVVEVGAECLPTAVSKSLYHTLK